MIGNERPPSVNPDEKRKKRASGGGRLKVQVVPLATKKLKLFQVELSKIKALEAQALQQAKDLASELEDKRFTLIRQAGESGHLYGSVSARDIAETLTKEGFKVTRNQVVMIAPIKTLGLHVLPILMHPEVEVPVVINVARSTDEADRQFAESLHVKDRRTPFPMQSSVGANFGFDASGHFAMFDVEPQSASPEQLTDEEVEQVKIEAIELLTRQLLDSPENHLEYIRRQLKGDSNVNV